MQKEKKQLITSIITIILLVLALIIILILYTKTSANSEDASFEDTMQLICNQEHVASVDLCNNQMLEIKSDLLGGGSRFMHRDGTSFVCPVVAPDAMSLECKAIFNAQQVGQWNCVGVC
jgi:hypothetical protein